MDTKDIITILLSSTLISTIITTVFNLIAGRTKDSIENIVKERKTWRDELRKIALSIQKSKNLTELHTVLSELKVRINAYGIANNSIFVDSHIWEQIYFLESCKSVTPEGLQSAKCVFVNQISCLLKYDWERSKAEIKGNTETRVVIFSLIICFLLYSIRWFYNYNIGSGRFFNYLSYSVVYSLFSAFALLMINFADKWKNRFQLNTFLISGVMGMGFLYWFMHCSVPSAVPYDIADWIINLAPFICLIYGAESKLLSYRRNVNHYILASALSSGATKINKKYKVFFDKKVYSNLLTDETITFDNFEEIIALRSTIFSYTSEKNSNED